MSSLHQALTIQQCIINSLTQSSTYKMLLCRGIQALPKILYALLWVREFTTRHQIVVESRGNATTRSAHPCAVSGELKRVQKVKIVLSSLAPFCRYLAATTMLRYQLAALRRNGGRNSFSSFETCVLGICHKIIHFHDNSSGSITCCPRTLLTIRILKDLDPNCGIRSGSFRSGDKSKIFGGEAARLGEWPWMVRMYLRRTDQTGWTREY